MCVCLENLIGNQRVYHFCFRLIGFPISASDSYQTSAMASFTAMLRNRRGDLPVAAKFSMLAGKFINVSHQRNIMIYDRNELNTQDDALHRR